MKTLSALAFAAATLAIGSAAHAVTSITLTENSGWHYGENHAKNSTNMYNYDAGGAQFTLKAVVTNATDYLSFVDGYIAGDVYSISIKSIGGTIADKTQFLNGAAYADIPKLYAGPFGSTFGPDWLQSNYGHDQIALSQGTYTITVKDLCGTGKYAACPGFPAGWGIRLDAAVPEPGAWALMLAGFGLLGASARTRRASLRAV